MEKEDKMAKDVVCGMEVKENQAAGVSEYKGEKYYFCSLACKKKFDEAPEAFIKSDEGEEEEDDEGEHHPEEKTKPSAEKEEARQDRIDLPIVGMSCASCVQNIEKALLQMRGVTKAAVNLATEKAKIEYIPSETSLEEIKETIEQTGYKVLKVPPEEELEDMERVVREKEYKRLKRKFLIGLALAVIIFLGSSTHWFPWIPDFLSNFFVLWALATPVQFWIGWQFYRGAWGAFKHRNADMNTLIAVGTSAAYLYSVVATVFPSLFATAGIEPKVYFDTSAIIIVLILFGRLLEARAKGQTSEAIKKLIGLQPKTARVIRDGKELDIPVEEVLVGDQARREDPC